MSLFVTAGSRLRQAVYRRERRRHTAEQTAEEGPGSIFTVPQLLRSDRMKKPLVVVGAGAENWSGRLLRALEESNMSCALWDDLPPAPTVADGENIRLAWIRESCDCFIVLGDGAAIDLVKAAAARAACRGQTIMEMVGSGRLHRKKLPAVAAIPTLAGTGRESLAWTTVTDDEGNLFVIEDPALLPPYAVMDPELLEDMPRSALADAVMDGLCLAVEAFLSGYGDDSSRRAAAAAAEGFFANAEPCWNSGGTQAQRLGLLRASRLAGEAASRAGAGYARALCRGAQKVTGAAFGDVCAGVLPALLEKYGNHAVNDLSALAGACGVAENGSKAENVGLFIARIRQLAFRIGLPELLDRVSPDCFGEIADLAAAEANPRYACPTVWNAEALAGVLERACNAQNRP